MREIIVRGSGGGPLTPLADQLNHELTRLQGQRIEGMLARLAEEIRNAPTQPRRTGWSQRPLARATLRSASPGTAAGQRVLPNRMTEGSFAYPPADSWVAAVHRSEHDFEPLGAAVLVTPDRVLTCAHIVVDSGGSVRERLWVAFPKAVDC